MNIGHSSFLWTELQATAQLLRAERARTDDLERRLQSSELQAANAAERIDELQFKEKELVEKSRDLVRNSLMWPSQTLWLNHLDHYCRKGNCSSQARRHRRVEKKQKMWTVAYKSWRSKFRQMIAWSDWKHPWSTHKTMRTNWSSSFQSWSR